MDKKLYLKVLEMNHAQLNSHAKPENNHLWQGMLKVEALKKEESRKKEQLLRNNLHSLSKF